MNEEIFNNADNLENSEPVEKKRRGRPAKTKAENPEQNLDLTLDSNTGDADNAPKKRRGRPPRVKEDLSSSPTLLQSDLGAEQNPDELRQSARNAASSAVEAARAFVESRKADKSAQNEQRKSALENSAGVSDDSSSDFDENSEANIFVHHNKSDEFAYNSSDDNDESQNDSEDEDVDYYAKLRRAERAQKNGGEEDEVPQYFSTSDEDLNPENYGRDDDSDDAEDFKDFDSAENKTQDYQSDSRNPKQNNFRNQRNRNFRDQREQKDLREQRDPREQRDFRDQRASYQQRDYQQRDYQQRDNREQSRGEWRDNRQDRQDNRGQNWQQNNRFQRDNRNQQGNQRNQNNQNNQRNQQGNQRNQQGNNRNQQGNQRNQNNQNNNRNQQGNQRNQNNQNNQRNQNNQQRLKNQKTSKIQIAGLEDDAINPANLPDWNVIKSNANIADWLAEVFFDIKKEEPKKVESELALVSQQEVPAQNLDTQSAAAELTQKSEISTENTDELTSENQEAAQALSPEQADFYSDSSVASEKSDVEKSDNDSEKLDIENVDEQSETPSEFDDENPSSLQDKSEVQTQQNSISTLQNSKEVSICEEPYNPDTAAVFKISEELKIESMDDFDAIYSLQLKEIQSKFDDLQIPYTRGAGKSDLIFSYIKYAQSQKKLVKISGFLDVFENKCGGALTYECDSYKLRRSCVYIPQIFIDKFNLQRGHQISVLATLPRESDAGEANCPVAVKLVDVAGGDPAALANLTPFTDLTPYYPTKRIIMEAPECAKWDNLSMRAVDLLTPVGRGQRALIVAPPRTGKTVLMQGMAKSIRLNSSDAHLIILLVDERPEEVTDFKRNVDAEVISSTFDEDPHSHVHAAEMVISKARRMVEEGKDVIILLDSITRLARAYNALMPNGGRTMSGGVEANALQKPKRFFGSARNIEGGGSLTIIATALVETGSKMDEVIFEEFKGTGNLELHLDRQLSDKRIFPAINMEKSGTRKEELLYHPDELKKIYTLRRAMKGVQTTDAMEMLIQRLKKVKTNIEFLMGLNS